MADTPVQYYNTTMLDGGDIQFKWWNNTGNDLPRHIFGVANRIWEYQKYRELANIRFARLYHNMELVSLRAGMFARTASQDNSMANRVTLNVVKSCVDTARAKISKNKPRPIFLTTQGDWSLQHKAKLLTQYIDGLFDHQEIYPKAQFSFLDACVMGTGALKLYENEDGQVDFERIICDEILVDETEGRYQRPRQMHQVKLIFREVLMDMFPKKKDQIKAATSGLSSQESIQCAADMVKVIESWHLRSSKDSDDGKHCIVIENATLMEEEYTKDYFPFEFFRWTPKLLGFFGMGLAEELIGIQLEINKILRNIQIAQHLMAVPQVWLEANSHVVGAHLNNEIGGIKKYNGTPPIFQVPQAMSQEIYAHLENLYRKAYEITGISQLSANAQKPPGVTAAVAMREMSDIESERFMIVAQDWEQFFVNITKKVIDMTRDLYKDNPDLMVKVKDGKFLKTIKWKDIDLDDEMYTMRVFPTSLLPSTPAGKLQKTQELLQAGFLDKDEALSLLDFPDTEKVTSLKTASRENIMRIIDLMITEGKYTSPEPFMNLQLALQTTQNAYLEAQNNAVPEDKLELLRRFMDDVQSMLTPPQQQNVQAGMAPGAEAPPQQAVPQGMPQSDLLPYQGQVQ